MKVSQFLKILTCILFFSAIMLVRVQVGSYSLFHLLILGTSLIVIAFSDRGQFRSFFKLDVIVGYLLTFLFIVILSYIVNISNASTVSKTYSSNSGESPAFLYLKIVLNGLIFIVSAMIAYLLGKSVSNSKRNFLRVYNFVIYLCLVNALINVIAWVVTTGGSIGRYNFIPPLTFSPGISIQYSSIGFILGLSALFAVKMPVRRTLFTILLAILLMSILIILTRQSQVSFIVMCIWYLFKTQKINYKTVLWGFPLMTLILLGALWIAYTTGSLDYYGKIDSLESEDIAIRLLMLTSSYEMFLTHPFLGVGYGMFVGHNTVPILITGVPIYLASPHNGIASIMAELGAVGLILIILITYVVIKKLNVVIKQVRDPIIKRYCISIYVIQVVLLLSVFISNSNLFGPPSEIAYLYISFISWFMIGSVLGVREAKDIS